MDQRHAKRHAARHLATIATQTAELIEQRYRSGRTWDSLSRADAVRVAVALLELGGELSRRGESSSVRVRATAPIAIHPDQAELVFEE